MKNFDKYTVYLRLCPQRVLDKILLVCIKQTYNRTKEKYLIVSQIEECDVEEIILDSDDEGEPEESIAVADRPVTPTPVHDFGASVTYTEGLKLHIVDES